MNLVQIANELEYVPKEQLAEMSQNPNSRFPQYLVISEIQRRTKNEKAYEAMKQQPTTTVAEEVVNEFIQPKGLQAGIPSGSAPTDVFSPESSGMPASAPMQQPMQMAASGGLTGYANGGALEESFANPQQSRISRFGENIFELGSDVANYAMKNPVEAASLGLMFIPGIGFGLSAGVRGLGLAYKGLKGIDYAKKAKQIGTAVKNAPVKAVTKPRVGQRVNTNQPMGEAAKGLGITDDVIDMGRMYSPLRTTATGAGILTAKQGYDYLTSPGDVSISETDTDNTTNIVDPTQAAKDAVGGTNNITSLSDFVAAKDKADRRKAGLDMAQLGGVILGSTNLTDLGKGIAGIASNIQTRDAAEGLTGAQKDYYEAQTGKLEAETRMMPAKELRTEIDTYAKYLKTLIEQNDGSEQSVAQITQVQAYINALGERLATMQGYATADSEATRNERLKASGISVT